MEIHPIARIHSDFPGKFGIPRQSGLVPELRSRIIFEPEYRNRDAIRGLEDFSHLWLIWEFSETMRGEWSLPFVRPNLAAISAWEYLQRDLHFDQIHWRFPV